MPYSYWQRDHVLDNVIEVVSLKCDWFIIHENHKILEVLIELSIVHREYATNVADLKFFQIDNLTNSLFIKIHGTKYV